MEKNELGELEIRDIVTRNGEAAFEPDVENNLDEAGLSGGRIYS